MHEVQLQLARHLAARRTHISRARVAVQLACYAGSQLGYILNHKVQHPCALECHDLYFEATRMTIQDAMPSTHAAAQVAALRT